MVVLGSFILLSRILIFSTILMIPFTEEKCKTFSTFIPDLTVIVTVHFGCVSIIYLRPRRDYWLEKDTLISTTYTVVTPLLNPVV